MLLTLLLMIAVNKAAKPFRITGECSKGFRCSTLHPYGPAPDPLSIDRRRGKTSDGLTIERGLLLVGGIGKGNVGTGCRVCNFAKTAGVIETRVAEEDARRAARLACPLLTRESIEWIFELGNAGVELEVEGGGQTRGVADVEALRAWVRERVRLDEVIRAD